MDISGDGLTDITVGAQGKVFILRSRPVMDVRVSMTFSPNKILLKHVDCPENRNELQVLVNICFKTKQITTQVQGTPSLNISYELKLDEHRKIERATLARQTTGTFVLTAQHCLPQTIQVKNCIQDFLNPIELNVVYSGEGVQSQNKPAPIIQSGNTGKFMGNVSSEVRVVEATSRGSRQMSPPTVWGRCGLAVRPVLPVSPPHRLGALRAGSEAGPPSESSHRLGALRAGSEAGPPTVWGSLRAGSEAGPPSESSHRGVSLRAGSEAGPPSESSHRGGVAAGWQ
ncbi:integrin alpha-M-like [Chiloscyllium punctatum]|uniref:integrin alpha-M-like n=1 Tax=Chiloscyllium punctatum TaxID=137246 RepID=UPI003B6417F9